MGGSFKGRMAEEISNWEEAGILSAEQAVLLHQRYDPSPFRGALILKWLGLFAIFMLAMSTLSLIGTLLTSIAPVFAALSLLAVASGVLYSGARLAAERAQKYQFTAQTLLTIGLTGFYAGLISIYYVVDGNRLAQVNGWFLLLTSAVGVLAAYRFYLRWPLLMGLLMFFHGIGSMTKYVGHGGYYLSIQDPRAMAVVAAMAVAWGLWHEQVLEIKILRRATGFGGLYLIFGLLYLNVSLWILSLGNNSWTWVVVFSVIAVLQIVAGAYFKDSRLSGFGVAFVNIDIYTRFYEFFWDSLSKALFFTLAGAWAMVLGYLFERRHRQVRGT